MANAKRCEVKVPGWVSQSARNTLADLYTLGGRAEGTQYQITHALGRPHSTSMRHLKSLSRAGLVEIGRGYARLTETGIAVAEEMIAWRAEALSRPNEPSVSLFLTDCKERLLVTDTVHDRTINVEAQRTLDHLWSAGLRPSASGNPDLRLAVDNIVPMRRIRHRARK